MKFIAGFFLFSFSLISAQMHWMSLEQAVEAQQKKPKKILMYFYAENHATSKLMQKQTFSHPVILRSIQDDFYAVMIDANGKETLHFHNKIFRNDAESEWHPFAQYMNVNFYPTLIFLDEKGQVITQLMGNFSAKELEPYLFIMKNEEYKMINSKERWENYQKKFKSKIKE